MKRLLTYLRITGAGTGRIVFLCAAALLIIYMVLTLFCNWSDRRFFGNVWFYHDLRYWPDVCSSLLWTMVIAMIWRFTGYGLSSVLLKKNSRHERRWRIVLDVFDWLGRMGTLVAGIWFLYRAGLSFSALFALIGKYWHWLFDPMGILILQGPGSAAIKGMPVIRFLWLPGTVFVVVLFIWLIARYTSLFPVLWQLIMKSWLAFFIAIGLGTFLLPIAGSFLSWFIDGFYRVPVTLFMASGRITWPLFVIPGLLIFFVVLILLSRRKRLQAITSECEVTIHD